MCKTWVGQMSQAFMSGSSRVLCEFSELLGLWALLALLRLFWALLDNSWSFDRLILETLKTLTALPVVSGAVNFRGDEEHT